MSTLTQTNNKSKTSLKSVLFRCKNREKNDDRDSSRFAQISKTIPKVSNDSDVYVSVFLAMGRFCVMSRVDPGWKTLYDPMTIFLCSHVCVSLINHSSVFLTTIRVSIAKRKRAQHPDYSTKKGRRRSTRTTCDAQ